MKRIATEIKKVPDIMGGRPAGTGTGSFGSPDNGGQLPGSGKIKGGTRLPNYHGPRDRVP